MNPNILVVMTDDHAQWALRCYGNSEVKTPSLDHLARTGVRMANAFTPSPVCSPARACFWTGHIPSQHGVHDFIADNDLEVRSTRWLAHETTLAAQLQAQGYFTGLTGKWHLGRPEQVAPGFDYWYSLAAPVPRAYSFVAQWTMPATVPQRKYNWHAVNDHAIDFLRRRPTDKPFFLFVGYFATHSPWIGHSERLVEQYRPLKGDDIPSDITYPFGRISGESLLRTRENPAEAVAQYYASVSEIDEQIGRLIDELEAQGVREDTLIIYTSDHGLNTGHHGLWGKGNATLPYNMLEESIRVPLILNQPGSFLGGQVRQEMVTHCDLYTTILDHAGYQNVNEENNEHPYPGISFRKACLGMSLPGWPDEVYGEYGNLRMVRSRRFKLVQRYPSGPSELFDLQEDPRETINVIGAPEYQELVQDMTRRIDRYFSRFADPVYSGLRVTELPRHNSVEAWRDNGRHKLFTEPWWPKELPGVPWADDQSTG